MCKVIFSMNDNDGNFEAKEIKRNTLLELIQLLDGENVNDNGMTQARTAILKSEKAMNEMLFMIRTNLIRTPK